MANSATMVFPLPVGAATSTERPAARCSTASIWNGSSVNGWVARKAATASEGVFVVGALSAPAPESSESPESARLAREEDDGRAPVLRGRWEGSRGGITQLLFRFR